MTEAQRIKRKFTKEMANKLRGLKILIGGHQGIPGSNGRPQVCVMEALAYITGQEVDDAPICVSPTITALMIEINDRTESDRKRNQLKKLIPTIMGTRPIEAQENKWGEIVEVAVDQDNEFQAAEDYAR